MVSSPTTEQEPFERCVATLGNARTAQHPDVVAKAALLGLRSQLQEVMDRSEFRDPRLFEAAHELVDEVGTLLLRHYSESCTFPYRDGTYYRECPVDIAHLRGGLSPEIRVLESECSICSLDPDDCDHLPGEMYDGRECLSIITKAEITAIAIVPNPRQLVTRFTSIPVGTTAELSVALGPKFRPGMQLNCNRCSSGCAGLNRDFAGANHG
ncbi:MULTISPECIES: hypothetical protein [Streptomyces griseus group]|uniref:hypothetical protein n=1 Tax=Streptomyces griseus group TaxID=629295 RepID=UPI00131C773A|nr:hypothetical protein [Streptomyces griseus]